MTPARALGDTVTDGLRVIRLGVSSPRHSKGDIAAPLERHSDVRATVELRVGLGGSLQEQPDVTHATIAARDTSD
jgi:hypothetical protein